MIIYNYHRDTKEYISTTIAREDPLEPGRYLLPACATTFPPPNIGTNEVAVYDTETNTWSIEKDYRGTKYYVVDGADNPIEKIIQKIGTDIIGKPLVPPSEDNHKPRWENGKWTNKSVYFEGIRVDEEEDIDGIVDYHIRRLLKEAPSPGEMFAERDVIKQRAESFRKTFKPEPPSTNDWEEPE